MWKEIIMGFSSALGMIRVRANESWDSNTDLAAGRCAPHGPRAADRGREKLQWRWREELFFFLIPFQQQPKFQQQKLEQSQFQQPEFKQQR